MWVEKIRTWYQGDDILYKIKFQNPDSTYLDLTTLSNVIAYFYTDKNAITKFSYVSKPDYLAITKIDNYTYQAVIPASVSSSMKLGTLCVELDFISSAEPINIIVVSYNIGLLSTSIIKAEV